MGAWGVYFTFCPPEWSVYSPHPCTLQKWNWLTWLPGFVITKHTLSTIWGKVMEKIQTRKKMKDTTTHWVPIKPCYSKSGPWRGSKITLRNFLSYSFPLPTGDKLYLLWVLSTDKHKYNFLCMSNSSVLLYL